VMRGEGAYAGALARATNHSPKRLLAMFVHSGQIANEGERQQFLRDMSRLDCSRPSYAGVNAEPQRRSLPA
jgi:hypothetical protein